MSRRMPPAMVSGPTHIRTIPNLRWARGPQPRCGSLAMLRKFRHSIDPYTTSNMPPQAKTQPVATGFLLAPELAAAYRALMDTPRGYFGQGTALPDAGTAVCSAVALIEVLRIIRQLSRSGYL
jgi:hypothetical protein